MNLNEFSIAPNILISFSKSSLSPGDNITELHQTYNYINSSIVSIFSFISLRLTKSTFLMNVLRAWKNSLHILLIPPNLLVDNFNK